MSNTISEIKKDMLLKLKELRIKRKQIILKFKKNLEEIKIKQIKNSILDK